MARPTPKKLALLKQLLVEKGIAQSAGQTIPRRDRSEPAPLSFGQRRMWFLDQFEPGTSLYNDALALSIRGIELDIDVFRRALDEIVRRHEILRTSFHMGADEPVQEIHDELELPFVLHDLRGRTDARERLDELLRAEVERPFELDRLPLIRATLTRLKDDEWVFGLTMHHIVSDGVAYSVVYEELGALYRSFSAGRPSPLAELAVQYADYARWQRDTITEERSAEMLRYWKRYLGGELPALRWPAKEVQPRNRGAYHRFRFSDGLYESLQEFCLREQVTSNWVLLAAYFTFLHVLSGQEDIRVGNPISTRKHRELEKLIGFFVQTAILRVDLAEDPTFRELLQRVRRKALEVARYEDVPFDRVVQAVRPGRQEGQVPLIQAWIAPMKDLMAVPDLPGATCEYEIVDGRTARFELALILDEARGGVSAFFEYDTDLFDRGTVERMAEQYKSILRQVVEHPDTTLRLLRETFGAMADGQKRRGRLKELKRIRRRVVEG